ncbi:MAG: helix-turn-helix transcriptional regulator [Ruminococcus sp.]|nr:helix-turn-helix transcriptional regulator [Ruminococcus sp.]
MNFPEKLQKLRKGRGWSQEELANRITVSRQAVSKWEKGVSHS